MGLLPQLSRLRSDAVRIWCALIVLACAGCGPAARLKLELRDGKPWLVADRPFSSIYCWDWSTLERVPFVEDKLAKTIWVGFCMNSQPCVESVRYGDTSLLISAVGPAALVPKHCYVCRVMRGVGNGEAVGFSFDESGNVEPCEPH